MTLTKVSRAGLNTGISDSSDATAITIDSNEDITITKQGTNTTDLRFANSSNSYGGNIKYDHNSGRMMIHTHNAERMRIDAEGNVGINTTNASDYYSDELVVTCADEGGMTFVTGTTHGNYINFADGTSGNAQYRGFLKYDHNNDKMTLGTSAAAAMEIDSGGRITNQNPSFLAHVSGSYPAMSIATVPFNHAVHNIGSHYSTSTYKFTAPVAGRYYLSYSVRVNHTTSTHIIHPCFRINGTNDTASLTIHKNDTTGQYMHTSFSYIRQLSASDYVTVSMANGTAGGGTMQDGQCSFSGHLLG